MKGKKSKHDKILQNEMKKFGWFYEKEYMAWVKRYVRTITHDEYDEMRRMKWDDVIKRL